ncbi:MAG: hypothetical protein CL931_06900 [Deltaproteobacteria bacterium]|nr:hypothetical protein [Deltaproteobacteria bacterium]
MDPKILFWAAALLNLGVLCGFGLLGVRYARRGEIARHRQNMKIASLLILGFLAAYVLKVVFLGREDQSVWSSLDVWVLRIHELFVVFMLVGGGIAWRQGRKLEGTRVVTRDPADPVPDPKVLQTHRRAGWTAVLGGVLAFFMAIGVLAGMIARAGA